MCDASTAPNDGRRARHTVLRGEEGGERVTAALRREHERSVSHGDGVRRQTGPWIPSVHRLLLHLRNSGIDWVPEVSAVDPTGYESDPSLSDRQHRPQATSWFQETATEMLHRLNGYLRILGPQGIAWRATWSSNPGLVLYEDEHQIVVVPSGG